MTREKNAPAEPGHEATMMRLAPLVPAGTILLVTLTCTASPAAMRGLITISVFGHESLRAGEPWSPSFIQDSQA